MTFALKYRNDLIYTHITLGAIDVKRYILGLVTLCLIAGNSLQEVAADNSVNIMNWSDYIDAQIISDFEHETGIKVVYDVFDSNDVLETKLLAGGSGYDVVVPSASFLARQIQAGVFQKLDQTKLTNKDNVWHEIEKRVASYDPENAYSVNYMWGTTGLGYNVEMIKKRLGVETLESWDVIFNPEKMSKLQDCGVTFLDAADEMIPAALHYLGKDPNSFETADLKAAENLLLSVRPYVQKFNSSEFISGLANGDLCLAIGWSGDVLQAQSRAEEAKNGVHIRYTIPKEGTQMWFDQMAIPADARNVENAHKFIDYILRAEVGAKLSNYVFYANGNKASQTYIEKSLLQDPAIFPPEDILQKLFTITPYPSKIQRRVTRSWTKIKSGN